MSEQLRPCPFCGNTPAIYANPETGEITIHCKTDGWVHVSGYDPEDLIAAWNTRVDPTRQALVDALKDAEVVLRMLKVSAPCDMSTNDMGKSKNLTHFSTLREVQGVLKQAGAL